jgi:hypothetical protein
VGTEAETETDRHLNISKLVRWENVTIVDCSDATSVCSYRGHVENRPDSGMEQAELNLWTNCGNESVRFNHQIPLRDYNHIFRNMDLLQRAYSC